MNKHLHRIVFNASRGLRMVVQETAKSTGRGARKATSGGAGASSAAVSVAAIAAALMSAPLHAQIVADPGAPGRQRPTVLVAPNGVPLINIQTPSAAGVSRNTYSQFDVQRNGAILNNSRGNAQTQLGGWVQGNPWLAGGSARVILNEVNSANPSQLRGYVEVAGPRTEVIIANPAGIQVDGGGFINVNRATLTTGTPQFNAQGGLDSFVVRGGNVSIDGAGLDAAKTDYAAIMARAVQVNAGIWANELKVVTGANQVSADSSQATPTTGNGAAPSFALDVAALGGMYAGKITLVGTEAGVGARNAGHIGAGAGGLVVTAAGRLENTGTVEGAKVELTSASDIDNRGGTIRQAGTRDISVTAPVLSNTNGGVIGTEPVATAEPASGTPSTDTAATGTGATPTTGTTTGTTTTTAGITEVAPLQPAAATGPGAISAAGRVLNDGGHIYAGGEISLNTPRIDNTGGSLSVGTLAVSGDRFSNAGGTLNISRDFSATVGAFDNSGGTLHAGDLRIQTASDLVNRDGSLTGNGAVDLTVGGNLANTAGTIVGNEAVRITAGGLTNEGGKIHAAGSANLTISVNGALTNRNKGEIGSGGNTTINAGALDNDAGRITAVGDLRVTALGAASNRAGTLAANRNATLDAASFDNSGGSVDAVGGDLAVTTTGAAVNQGGKLRASGAVRLANGGLDNTDGQIIGGQVTVDAKGNALTNVRGTLASTATTVDIASGALNNTAGLIQSKAALTLDTHGQALTNVDAAGYADGEGGITSAGAMTLHTGAVDNSAGFVGADGALTASSDEFINGNGGVVVSRTAVDVDTRGARYDNRGGQTLSTGDLVIASGRIDNEAGLIRSGETATLRASSISNTHTQGSDQGIEAHNLRVTADTVTNTVGAIRANADAMIVSSGNVDNTTGLISAKGALRISDSQAGTATPKALEIVNTDGTLTAGENLLLDAARFSGDGTVVSDKDLAITLSKDVVNNGAVSAAGTLSYVTTGTLTNNSKLYATQTLSVGGADVLNNAAGELSAGQKTAVTASGTLTNRGLIDGADTQVNAGTLDNLGTGRIYGDRISLLAADTLNNGAETVNGVTSAASIAARDTLHIGAKVISNSGHAQIFSVGDAAIGGALDGNRQVVGQGATLTNSAATLDIGGNLRLAVDQVNNLNPTIRTEQVAGPAQHFLEYAPAGSSARLSGGTYDRRSSSKDQTYAYYTSSNGQRIQAKEWTIWDYERNTAISQVVAGSSDPGQILVGGNLDYSGNALRNQASKIVIGGALTGNTGALNNEGLVGVETTTDHGTATHSYTERKWYSGSRRNRRFERVESYDPAVPDRTFTLKEYTYEHGVKPVSGQGPDGLALANVTANTATVGQVSGGNRAGVITEVATGVDGVVRTSQTGSLFRTTATGHYLIETDPRFASYRSWISSDYLLNALGQDPNNLLKRLGDGFYEQKLIREQIAQLTGYRYLDGFESDETQYTALMNAGVTFAKTYGLRPGIALSAAQMAQLTSDIVWLVEQSVTLADGSTQRVLVPQVYVRVKPGDIDGGGALLSANALHINNAPGTGTVTNTGTLAGRTLVAITADNIDNLGGRIVGGSVGINARNDLNNIGGSIEAQNAAVLTAGHDINIRTTTSSQTGAQGSRTSIDRVAGVYVTNPGGTLIASAGNDVNLVGAILSSAGTVAVGAGRDINLGTVTTARSEDVTWDAKNYRRSSQSQDVGSVIAGDGAVRLAAGHDLDLRAATVVSNKDTLIATAGNDLRVEAGQSSESLSTASFQRSKGLMSSSTHTRRDNVATTGVVASTLSGNSVALVAGQDITLQAAQLKSDGAMSLSAGRDITLSTASQSSTESHFKEDKRTATGLGKLTGIALGADTVGAKLISSNAALNDGAVTRTDAIGSTISAGSLQTVSGRDTTLQGATVVADNDITMLAGRDLTIESAQNTTSGSNFSKTSQSGMIGTRTNPSFGNVKQDDASQGSSVTQSSSQVASLKGDVTLVAGGTYRQTASSVLAAGQAGPLVGGDVNVLAKNVVIDDAYNTSNSRTQSHSASTVLGGSASVGGISTDTLRGATNTVKAMGDTGDGRMQALGAVNLAMQGKQVYDTATQLAGGGMGYKVSVNVSRNKSESQSTTQSSEAVGSSIVGANNVNIVATGGGAESNIRAIGSTIAAGNTVNLAADNAITLAASQNTWEQHGTNKSSGTSVGVGYAAGAQNGFTIELGMSQGKGKQDGSEVSYNNTHVSGGKAVNVQSGGDLNIKGAVIAAPKVTADVGGNLNIESLQDTSSQVSKQNSSGFNASLCIPPICYGVSTVGGSVAAAKANGSYASVTEQSGIKAGDGGFDVSVKGNTDLKGGVISSTQAAIDEKKNSFQTASLTTSDIENHSTYKASGYSVSGSVSGTLGDQSTATSDADKAAVKNAAANSRPGGSAGVGSASGSQTSTTKAGISGIAGDTSARSDDTAASTGALVKKWDTASLIKDVQAQTQITQEFGQRAAYQIGTYADKKYNELKNSDPAEAAKWLEGGEYRVAAHAASGLLTGGIGGALGAGVSAALMPRIGEAIADMGLPAPVAQAVGAATAAAIGATAGGAAGAATAYNVDVNNRQLHPTETKRIKELANGDPAKEARLAAAACALTHCADGVPPNDPNYSYLQGLQSVGNSDALSDERALLSNQPGSAHSAAMLFRYDTVDATGDWLAQNAMGTRTGGAVQGGLGVLGVAGSASLCATLLGCAAGAVGATVSADLAQAGIKQAATGEVQTAYGQQALQSLGLSATSAALTYGLLGVSPAIVEGIAVSRAFSAAAQYNSLARASYSDFVTNGVPITPATMQTPIAQAVISEIKAGSPSLPDVVAAEYAKGIIASGTALPVASIKDPGTTLVKVVPKGDGVGATSPYWMTQQQAKIISEMSPAEAGMALGLPAAQAANIF